MSDRENSIFWSLANYRLNLIPLGARSKKPIGPWKEYQARWNTSEELDAWSAAGHNVGIVTGRLSNITALDADSDEAIAMIEAAGLPQTPWVQTSRGRHYLFRMPEQPLGNRAHVGGIALDVRGEGGYVVGAGSIHPDGTLYAWGLSPEQVDFAPFPLSLIPHSAPASARRSADASLGLASTIPAGISAFLAQALSEACDEIRRAEEGTRNNTLYQQAKDMAKHVAAVGGDWEPFASVLGSAASDVGADGVAATLKSAWTGGSVLPTEWLKALVDHVYLSAHDRFYHPRARKYFTRAGFSAAYAYSFREKGGLANFAINTGSIINVADVTYDPRRQPGVVEVEGLRRFNVYEPSPVYATDGDPSPFVDFLSYLLPNQAEREHLLKVMAHTVRNPGDRVRHAILLRSTAHGIGKSMLSSLWGELVGRSNVRKTTTSEIMGAFESWAIMNTLNVIEELDNNSGLIMYNKLKDFITGETKSINEKHLQPREWPLFSTFFMLSNRSAPLLIEENDRRLFVMDSPALPREPAYYAELAGWFSNNAGVVRHYLDQVDLSDFNPHAPPPMTNAKAALIGRSKSLLAQDLEYLISNREEAFAKDVVTLQDVRSSLGGVVNKSDRELGRAMGDLGVVRLGQVGTGYQRKSLWISRNVEYWRDASSDELLGEANGLEPRLPEVDRTVVAFRHPSRWPGQRSFKDDWALCAPRKKRS